MLTITAGWANQWTEIVACGGWGAGENIQTWDVTEGSTITATWDQWPEGHKGGSDGSVVPLGAQHGRC